MATIERHTAVDMAKGDRKIVMEIMNNFTMALEKETPIPIVIATKLIQTGLSSFSSSAKTSTRLYLRLRKKVAKIT